MKRRRPRKSAAAFAAGCITVNIPFHTYVQPAAARRNQLIAYMEFGKPIFHRAAKAKIGTVINFMVETEMFETKLSVFDYVDISYYDAIEW